MKTVVLKGDQYVDGTFYRDGSVVVVDDDFEIEKTKEILVAKIKEENGQT